jgi:hypothetical protein
VKGNERDRKNVTERPRVEDLGPHGVRVGGVIMLLGDALDDPRMSREDRDEVKRLFAARMVRMRQRLPGRDRGR